MTVAFSPQLSAERPFPGLRAFTFEDREFFFGREQQIFALYRLLDLSRFIAVVGGSGSGKSSLVRAGLEPLVEQESEADGGRPWMLATMHPGEAPISSLSDALASLHGKIAGAADTADHAIRRSRIEHALRRSSRGLLQLIRDTAAFEKSAYCSWSISLRSSSAMRHLD